LLLEGKTISESANTAKSANKKFISKVRKTRKEKRKPIIGLRRCQFFQLAAELSFLRWNGQDYN
jgi:hypothetical protein